MIPAHSDFARSSLELADQLLVNFLYRYPESSVAGARSIAHASVYAVGVGEKVTNGKPTGQMALRIHVFQKLPPALIPPDAILPQEFQGLPTDVIEAPVAFRRAPTQPRVPRPDIVSPCPDDSTVPQRPIIGGIAMASERVTSGTLACFCRSTRAGEGDRKYALTTGHVLGSLEGGQVGDLVLQPSMGDVGTINNRIGVVDRMISIERGRRAHNLVDGGVALLDPQIEINNSVCGIGPIRQTKTAAVGMHIRKRGRSTQITEGIVTDFPIHTVINLNRNDLTLVARFDNQIRIESADQGVFAEGGDSGSLVVETESSSAVGLFFAAPEDDVYAFANPIDAVFKSLDIDLL